MPAPAALGVRRRCLSCTAAFYDLNRTPIVCPKCGVEFTPVEYARRPEPFKKYGAPYVRVVKPEPEEAEPAAEAGEDETLLADEDEDDEAPVANEDAEHEPE